MNTLEKRYPDIVIDNHTKLLNQLEFIREHVKQIRAEKLPTCRDEVVDLIERLINQERNENRLWLENLKSNP